MRYEWRRFEICKDGKEIGNLYFKVSKRKGAIYFPDGDFNIKEVCEPNKKESKLLDKIHEETSKKQSLDKESEILVTNIARNYRKLSE